MLAGHEEGRKHVGNIPVSNDTPVLILLSAKSGHHVAFILRASKEVEGVVTCEISKLTILFSALRL